MPVYRLETLREEFVTPKHSTAFGRLVTGEQIEVGMLRYKAGEGATMHAHPHEQIIIVLHGRARATIDGKVSEVGPGTALHMRPNVPHALEVLEDCELVSCKSIVAGVGHKI